MQRSLSVTVPSRSVLLAASAAAVTLTHVAPMNSQVMATNGMEWAPKEWREQLQKAQYRFLEQENR